ncbi:hypothetical protein CesoFtcFv8_023094 [Champsocephalus esox]|uniref:Uncharacterized protein n=1 Tax=Champsocephalus esox TaxID=159716 RepID=A0AAN8B7I5_9TELE|nr:hypothetical protein CesoFtcFv8_023094 [Champsocephalus esox]
MPRPYPELDCRTSCKQLPSCPEEEWRQGSRAKLQERARPVFGRLEVYINRPVPQDTNRYLNFADLYPRFVGFPPQFKCPGQKNSALSLPPPLCQTSSGTNSPVNPKPSFEA